MLQQFTARFFQLNKDGTTRTDTVTLTDNDLVRGNDADESVELFNGTQQLVPGVGFVTVNDGEATTSVFFNDGTAIAGVDALYERITFKFLDDRQYFLLDTEALARVGKTLDDVASVRFDGFVDHDLNWDDFGFVPTGVVVPDPEPEPPLNLVQGTAGNDRLTGTAGNDLIRGGDGDDRLTGLGGEDTFVFGADARDGDRDRDVITDFDALEDSIVLEEGVQVQSWNERDGNLIVRLEGDRDTIVIQNADSSILANFSVTDGLFAA